MKERPPLERELAKLKGFQRRTVDYAFDRLYLAEDSSHRFLVADEVGLGKTLVARGVIAKAVEHLWDTVDRIDILYICSNSVIARQNVARLSLLPEEDTHQIDRITLLPSTVQQLQKRRVNFIAFTPGTSFDLKSSGGRWGERIVLYWMLQRVWPTPGTGPKNLMQGRVEDAAWFRRQLRRFASKTLAVLQDFLFGILLVKRSSESEGVFLFLFLGWGKETWISFLALLRFLRVPLGS